MKVYLLLINDKRFFFYSDESEADEAEDEAAALEHTGLYGWLERRWRSIQTEWQNADAGLAYWSRRAWIWLHKLSHPDGSMLIRLRSARRIALAHPASRSSDEVEAIWRNYLAQRGRRHLIWLGINLVIAPFAFALFWLPGPNVPGYWFAYRAIHHFLIVRGIRRVQLGKIPTSLQPLASLDLPVQCNGEGKASHAALNGNATQLDDYLSWSGASEEIRRGKDASPRASPDSTAPTQD